MTLKFCQKCSNLLYPREDPERKGLVYACHHCDYEEQAQSSIVYYKELNPERGNQPKPLLNSEPILPRTKSVRCPTCRHQEATLFQTPMPDERDKKDLALVFVCCNPRCGHRWQS